MIDFKNRNLNELINSGELKIVEESIHRIKLSNADKVYFYIKPHNKNNQEKLWMREILGERIANHFNIPSVHYIKVPYTGRHKDGNEISMSGVISESFVDSGKHYLTGKELLFDYLKSLSNGEDFKYYGESVHQLINKSNNLELLWHALEYRYQDRPNKNEIVKKLMEEFIQLYEFSILTNDWDKHWENYQIVEYKDEVKLAPYYDFDNIFGDRYFFKLLVDLEEEGFIFDSLSKYLLYIDSLRIEEFKRKLESLTKEVIEKFLDDIIKENCKTRKEKLETLKEKESILRIFERNRNILYAVLNEYNKGKNM